MSRPVALLAWELGAGLGHARRLLAVGRGLVADGFDCVMASRELWACADEIHAAGIRLVQAPHHRGLIPRGVEFRARGYADMMAACGYQREQALWPTVLGWDGMIDTVRPDVIVADYAPMLALAAHGRVPMLAIGDGFVLPPTDGTRFPVLREGTRMAEEPVMLAHAAAIQRRRGLPAPESLPALIGGAARIVCTYPQSDIFAGTRLEPAAGPVEPQPAPLPPPAAPALFVYLAADFAHTAKLLQVVSDLRLPTTAFVRDAPDSLKAVLRASGVTVHDRPPPLRDALRAASLVVHHGGIGTIETCLAAGRPQFVLPRHFEQTLNADVLVRLGIGQRLGAPFSLAAGFEALSQSSGAKCLGDTAQTVAYAIAAQRPGHSLELILSTCRGLAR